ncbi:30S ribosomal protein THX [Marivirga harenae]|uniref:30S ribosomal protein THX n=1 Tax=Marivirga harenae TaxID=2010992 RepID=UPI0026E05B86|nr:30S ribosomal protein THX [Marivirga harenae]WKV12319.1 30S ribosomal protein THX [Marivirga harenae]|tara:strand:+ start:37621 stop:37827 length:207 start_codon:yes stop_codon:yes gene_type:complete
MGKGDKKTKKGKIFAGSFGVRRPKKTTSSAVIPKAESKEKKASTAKKDSTSKKTTAAKKTTTKKKTEK